MRSKTRLLVLAVVALVSLAGSGRAAVAAGPPNMVLTWNQTFLSAIVAANVPPPAANRLGAVVQSAVFDAVNGIEKRYTPIHVPATGPDDASPQAAAAAAAHEALVKLFPTLAPALDAQLAASLQTIADDEDAQAVDQGVAWGTAVADKVIAWRATDGFSATPPTYVFDTAPGKWRSTPGGPGGPPRFRTLATTTPFALTSPSQFRPAGPPALDSARYAQDVAEVQTMGAANSTQRTAYQTQTAVFWGVGDTPVAMWDRVADGLAAEHHYNLMKSARLLALLNMSIADAVIAVFEAKNFYNSWRPITAINLTSDPSWTPLLVNPYFQEYPSAHSGTSSAAGAVLASAFGEDTTFTVTSLGLPGVQRTYTSFSSAVAEVGDARVFAGIHFRSACDDAIALGITIAAYVRAHMVLPAE
jgi:PAP2 superfamily